MIDADGLALMLWIAGGGLVFILAAWLVELYQGRDMRRRARRRALLRRYLSTLEQDHDAWTRNRSHDFTGWR